MCILTPLRAARHRGELGLLRARAITFDLGGTLDGPGTAWGPRFLALYRAAGVDAPEYLVTRAFHDADDHLHERHDLRGLDLLETVRLQVADTLGNLGRKGAGLAEGVAQAFVRDARAALRDARPLLEALGSSFSLGVVSNNYGNLKSVLEREGLSHLFATVIDSRELGFEKPDARIFFAACAELHVPAALVVHVGDSLKRDVGGARAAGLQAVWFAPEDAAGEVPEPGTVRIRRLSEIQALIRPVRAA
jgi:HAD superfamily hydrolase (TIGR01509 family)